jgi:hypothetical protein
MAVTRGRFDRVFSLRNSISLAPRAKSAWQFVERELDKGAAGAGATVDRAAKRL